MIREFQEIITQKYKKDAPMKRVAVVCAESAYVIEAVEKAYEDGLVEPILIGNEEKIKEIMAEINCRKEYPIVDARNTQECLGAMQELVHSGKVDAVMKGLIETKDLMSAIVKDKEFRTGDVITSICLFKVPNYPKLLSVLDSGVVMYPTLEQKAGIIKDAVKCYHSMGYDRPKVAVLCSVDMVNPKMPETVDAQKLTQMGEEGVFGECEVYGPLSYDLCIDKEAAVVKGCESPVAGDADIIIVPDINTGNALVKCLYLSAEADSASMILGTKVPVIITSRSAKAIEKYWSIVFSCALQ